MTNTLITPEYANRILMKKLRAYFESPLYRREVALWREYYAAQPGYQMEFDFELP
jgi:hypothetical protein